MLRKLLSKDPGLLPEVQIGGTCRRALICTTFILCSSGQLAAEVCCEPVFQPFGDTETTTSIFNDGATWEDPKVFRRYTSVPDTREQRAALYKAAVLSSLTLDNARRLHDVSVPGSKPRGQENTMKNAVQLGLGATGTASDVAELVRWSKSASKAKPDQMAGLEKKISARFGKTKLGKAGKWSGPLSVGITVASEYSDERERVAILQNAMRDYEVLQTLDLLAQIAEEDHIDPAIIDGIRQAQEEISRHSEDSLKNLSRSSVRALVASGSEIAGFGVGVIATAGPALLFRETVELGIAYDEFEKQASLIAAQHNFVSAFSEPLSKYSQAEKQFDGFDANTPYEEANVLMTGLSLEANAGVYNALWEDRWDVGFSVARIGKALGLTVSSIGGTRGLKKQYRQLVESQARKYQGATSISDKAYAARLSDLSSNDTGEADQAQNATAMPDRPKEPQWKTAPRAAGTYYAFRTSNVRSGPNTTFDKAGRIDRRTKVRVERFVINSEGNTWAEFKRGGKLAYVSGRLLFETRPEPLPKGVKEHELKYKVCEEYNSKGRLVRGPEDCAIHAAYYVDDESGEGGGETHYFWSSGGTYYLWGAEESFFLQGSPHFQKDTSFYFPPANRNCTKAESGAGKICVKERGKTAPKPISTSSAGFKPLSRPQTRYTSTNLNMRVGPGTSNPVATVVSKGDEVTVIGTQKDKDGDLWMKIRTKDNQEGFVSKKYLAERVHRATKNKIDAHDLVGLWEVVEDTDFNGELSPQPRWKHYYEFRYDGFKAWEDGVLYVESKEKLTPDGYSNISTGRFNAIELLDYNTVKFYPGSPKLLRRRSGTIFSCTTINNKQIDVEKTSHKFKYRFTDIPSNRIELELSVDRSRTKFSQSDYHSVISFNVDGGYVYEVGVFPTSDNPNTRRLIEGVQVIKRDKEIDFVECKHFAPINRLYEAEH
jgi:uncharacterized protein YgiM (DUF1202 family)